jgi:hypothetical protein
MNYTTHRAVSWEDISEHIQEDLKYILFWLYEESCPIMSFEINEITHEHSDFQECWNNTTKWFIEQGLKKEEIIFIDGIY